MARGHRLGLRFPLAEQGVPAAGLLPDRGGHELRHRCAGRRREPRLARKRPWPRPASWPSICTGMKMATACASAIRPDDRTRVYNASLFGARILAQAAPPDVPQGDALASRCRASRRLGHGPAGRRRLLDLRGGRPLAVDRQPAHRLQSRDRPPHGGAAGHRSLGRRPGGRAGVLPPQTCSRPTARRATTAPRAGRWIRTVSPRAR